MTAPERCNLLYAQSGGVTAVINATAAAVIDTARATKKIDKVFAGQNGIMGVLLEELYETWHESDDVINALSYTPGGVFGSCRTKLPDPGADIAPYQRLEEVFSAHHIGYFLYNGGNDSADTTQKISTALQMLGSNVVCVGVPKTIDNDLPMTDNCPGFGSAAKYVAVSAAETMRDVAAMARTSTKVFVFEVMGRHAGWIAAAAGLASEPNGAMIILFPEVPFNRLAFLEMVKKTVRMHGYVIIVVSEGVKDGKGVFLAAARRTDNFSHRQLGGVAPVVASIVQGALGYKTHWAVSDYLQRSARHIASLTDRKQAEAVGKAAVKMACANRNAMMPVIWRVSDTPYKWDIGEAPLNKLANRERKLPAAYISKSRFFITPACRQYLTPLIVGEDYPPYKNGLPSFACLKNKLTKKKLPAYEY